MINLEGLDYQNALKRMGGNEDLYYRMIDSFQKEYNNFPERLKEQMANESDNAYVLTHSLKNISAAIGALSLTEAAEQMEVFLKDHCYSGNELYLQRLFEEFESVKLLLDCWENPLKEQRSGNMEPSEFLIKCRKALEQFSPTAVQECRQQLEEGQWPDAMNQYRDSLIESLKGFRYEEAEEILDQISRQVKR